MLLMKCTEAIIEKRNELKLSDKEARKVMELLYKIQDLNEVESLFFDFAFGEIVKELSKDV